MSQISDTYNAILSSAGEAILRDGILGLRVAEVAADAQTSLTQVYRYFGNRDGLLAKVLGDLYDEQSAASVRNYLSSLPEDRKLTINDLVDAFPVVLLPEQVKFHELRIQILATATHNGELHDRLRLCSKNILEIWTLELALLQERMAKGENFDERFFLMVFTQQNPYYRVLLGSELFNENDYRDFLREKLRRK